MISVNMWPIKFEYRARPGKKIKEGDQSEKKIPHHVNWKNLMFILGFFLDWLRSLQTNKLQMVVGPNDWQQKKDFKNSGNVEYFFFFKVHV